MKLIKAEPSEAFPISHLVSENGIWEMGIHPVMYGARVSVSKVGSYIYTIDYCAGANQSFILQLLAVVYLIVSLLPETITSYEMEQMFPDYQVRPIDKDPCWEKLQKLLARLQDEEKDGKNS